MSDSEAESNRDWIVLDNQQNSDSDSGASSSGFVHVGSSVVSYQRMSSHAVASQLQDGTGSQPESEDEERTSSDEDKKPDDVMPIRLTEKVVDSTDPAPDLPTPESAASTPEAVDEEEDRGPDLDFHPSTSAVVSESSASSSSEIEKLELPEDTEDYGIDDGCHGYEYEENNIEEQGSVDGARSRTCRRQSTSESDMSDIVKLEVATDEERSSEERDRSYSRPSDLMQVSAASTSSSSGSSCRFHFIQPLSVQHRYVYGPNQQDTEPVPDDVDDRCESDISGVASDENDPDLSTVSYNLDDLEIMEGDVMRSYKHKPNSSLNTLLTLLTLFTLCVTIGVGFGHYLATRRIATRRDQQTIRMNELQDNYLRCLQQQDKLQAEAATTDKDKIAAVTAVWKQKYEELIIENVDLQLSMTKLQTAESSITDRVKFCDPEGEGWRRGSHSGTSLTEDHLDDSKSIVLGASSDPLNKEGSVEAVDLSTTTNAEVSDQPSIILDETQTSTTIPDPTGLPVAKTEPCGQPGMNRMQANVHPSVSEDKQACSREDNRPSSVTDTEDVAEVGEVFADFDDQASVEIIDEEIILSTHHINQIITDAWTDEPVGGQNQPSMTDNEGHDQPSMTDNEGRDQPSMTDNEGHAQPSMTDNEGLDQPSMTDNEGRDEPSMTENKPSETGLLRNGQSNLVKTEDEDPVTVTDAEDDTESSTGKEDKNQPSMTVTESIRVNLPESGDKDEASEKVTEEEVRSPVSREAGKTVRTDTADDRSQDWPSNESPEKPGQTTNGDQVTSFLSKMLMNSSAMAKYQQFVNKTKQRVSKLSKKIEKTWNKVKNLTGDFLKENQAVKSITDSVYKNMETLGNSIESAWNEARTQIPMGNMYHKDDDHKPKVKKAETAKVQPGVHSKGPNNTKRGKQTNKKSLESRSSRPKQATPPPYMEKSGKSMPKYSNTAAKSAKHLEHDAKHKEKKSSTIDHAQYAEYWKQAEFEPDDFFQEGFFEGNNREWRKQQKRVRKLHGRLARLNENVLLTMDEDDVEDFYEDFDDVHDDLDESHLPDSLMTWLTCQVRWWKSRLFRKNSNEDLVKGCVQKLMQWQLKALCTQPCGKHDKKCKKRQKDKSLLQGPFCQHYQTVILPSIPQDSTDQTSGDSTKPIGQNNRQTVKVVAEPNHHMSGHVHNPYGTVHYEIDNQFSDVDHNDTDTDSGPSADWVFERAEDRESHHHDGSWLFKRDKVRTFEREKPWFYKRADNRAQLRSAKTDRKT